MQQIALIVILFGTLCSASVRDCSETVRPAEVSTWLSQIEERTARERSAAERVKFAPQQQAVTEPEKRIVDKPMSLEQREELMRAMERFLMQESR